MGNQVTAPPQTLQERVGARIREQIGDLLTDEDLKRLVETALHDAFFKREVLQTDSWSRPTKYKEARIVEIVQDLLKDRVDTAVKSWLDANQEEFEKHIDDAIGKGLIGFLTTWIDDKFRNDLYNFGNALKSTLLR